MKQLERETIDKNGTRKMLTGSQTINPARKSVHLTIAKNWDGTAIKCSEQAEVTFYLDSHRLEIEVKSPFHDDPAPAAPVGKLDGLWNYEVVELFLLGTRGHYLEIEIGPHGHFLILLLSAVRQVSETFSPARCVTRITGPRWYGNLTLSLHTSILPFSHVNAYAIHGQGLQRRYLSTFPVPGEKPDFHQPQYFGRLDCL